MSALIYCPDCNSHVPDDARFCPSCFKPRSHVERELQYTARLTGTPYQQLLAAAQKADGLNHTSVPEVPRTGTSSAQSLPNPFQASPLQEPTKMERLRRRKPVANAMIEVNNLLARGILRTMPGEIDEVSARYAIDVRKAFSDDWHRIYRRCVSEFMGDQGLPAEARAQLAHLAGLTGVHSTSASQIQSEVASARFVRVVSQAFSGPSRSIDRLGLYERGLAFGLSQPQVERVYAQQAQNVVGKSLQVFIDSGRWGPAEEHQILQLASSYGVGLKLDQSTQSKLDRLRLHWAIENGDMPAIDVDINLQRGETAHFAATADWFENRTVTRRVNYAGPAVRIKIAKGIYYRAGSANIQTVSEEVMREIDTGAVYFTNKRVIFVGGKRNVNIRLNRILDFNVFSNGIEVVKDAGRNPFFQIPKNVDIAALVLDRVIRDQ